MISVTFVTNGGKVAAAEPNTNLLRISLREKGGIPFKCGAGICGTIENTDAVKAKERNHLTEDDLKAGFRMACQTFVLGDVSVSWVAKEKALVQPAIDREGLVLARTTSK